MTIDKVWASPAAAVADIPDGASVAIAGFGVTHSFPSSLTVALRAQGAKDLTLVANSLGLGPFRSIALVENHQVRRLIVSFTARAGVEASAAELQIASGDIEVEMVPQGTLVERLRAGGAGIGAFYTRTGVGTAIAEGKETRTFGGVEHVLELGLNVDYAFIRAARGDRFGNLRFEGVGANFMPSFAKAATITVAEVDEIVDELDAPAVHLPGIFVTRVVQKDTTVPYDFLTSRAGPERAEARHYHGKPGWNRFEIAEQAAALLAEPSYVNLGLGIPTLISNYIEGRDIVLHSENGVLGYGRLATQEDFDTDLYNAAGQYVHLDHGASFFDSVTSFEMVRGAKVGTVVLGAFQVDAQRNIANWSSPEMTGGAIGGAMDLVSGGGRVMVLMTHQDNAGRPKLLRRCTYPLTGVGCVETVVTDLCVAGWNGERFAIQVVAPGFTPEEVAELAEMDLALP